MMHYKYYLNINQTLLYYAWKWIIHSLFILRNFFSIIKIYVPLTILYHRCIAKNSSMYNKVQKIDF